MGCEEKSDCDACVKEWIGIDAVGATGGGCTTSDKPGTDG